MVGRPRPQTEIDPAKIRQMLIPDITPFRIGLFCAWALGIFMMNNAPAPYKPPLEDLDRYDELQARADTMIVAIEAEKQYWAAYSQMEAARGFFYNDPTYEGKKRHFQEREAVYLRENAKRQALRDEANKIVGIWSEYGLEATRQGFWKAYEKGKQFAKSMTWWDVMFTAFGASGRGGRDENLVVYLLQWVLRIAMNFTIGFLYSLVSFLINLFWIIADFSPDPTSAVAFYLCGFVAATAMVVSVLVAMYGTIATVVIETRAPAQRVMQVMPHWGCPGRLSHTCGLQD